MTLTVCVPLVHDIIICVCTQGTNKIMSHKYIYNHLPLVNDITCLYVPFSTTTVSITLPDIMLTLPMLTWYFSSNVTQATKDNLGL